jgi:SAM-dependent methyltransferase
MVIENMTMLKARKRTLVGRAGRALKRAVTRKRAVPDHALMDRARELNAQLYERNPDLDPALVARVERELQDGATELNYDAEFRCAWMGHKERIAASIQALHKLLQPGAQVLELGGFSVASLILRKHFPNVTFDVSQGDLRSPWSLADESRDGIISMEVFEHLLDLPDDDYNHAATLSGFRAAVRECRRVLKPGGWLFFTTPNITSIVVLQRLMYGAPPMFFRPHHREYSRKEIEELFADSGMELELRCVHCMSLWEKLDYSPIFHALLQQGYTVADRGDDWFGVARRR